MGLTETRIRSKNFLAHAQFPELTELGITDSEIQDELTEVVLDSKFMEQITTLDLSNGTLTDKGGALLLEKSLNIQISGNWTYITTICQ